jgi:hypothetical protein
MDISPQRGAIMRLYATMMDEIKARLFAIDHAQSGKVILPKVLIREFCQLQLRMICELIALSCLIAHGEIHAGTSLQKEWSADRIMDRLAKLHPHFYPWPIEVHEEKNGVTPFSHIREGFLTKDDLIKLNGQCGDALHRGSLKNLLKSDMALPDDFTEIANATARIRTLLELHRIVLIDHTIIFCTLSDSAQNGNVVTAIAGIEPSE